MGQTNLKVLNQFVNDTDKVVKALIPREDAWKIKNHAFKNLNVKIHTAELINTMKSSHSRSKHASVLESVDKAAPSLSRSRSPKQIATVQRAKTSLHKSRTSPNHEPAKVEDDNESYEAYVKALSRRANMQ